MSSPEHNHPDELRVDIAVCTFRRPAVKETLLSLADLVVPPHVTVRIIIADNDVTPSARDLIEGLRAAIPFEITYVHCPASNISIARNACLDASSGDFLAFIDDDEMASVNWLSQLLKTAGQTSADAVLGPVRASYNADAPRWMRKGDFHSTRPVWIADEIVTGYTCNVLLRRTAPSLDGRRFSLALGKTGGEDTEFFARMHDSGGRLAFAPEAWVFEPVPESRARFVWLAKRRFRSGQTHGRLLGEAKSGLQKGREIALACAKMAYCLAAGAALFFSARRRNRFALRACLHAGAVSGLLGLTEIQQYGTLETTA